MSEEVSAPVSVRRAGEGELGSYFGCVLAMPELSAEEWSRCVEEFRRFGRRVDAEEDLTDDANKHQRAISTQMDDEKASLSLTSARVHSEIMYD